MIALLLSTVFVAAAAGLSRTPPVSLQEAGTPARAPDGGTTRAYPLRPGIPSTEPPRGGVVQVNAVENATEPSLRISVQEPVEPDSASPRKKRARTEWTDGQPDSYMEALQQIAAQQQASEVARIAEQHAQTQRAGQLNGARLAIGGALQSLQAMGDWNPDALESTGASLRQTAAAASEAGSSGEASRAVEAARFVEAAHAALAQRNSQLAQYYLLEANQLLAPNVRY